MPVITFIISLVLLLFSVAIAVIVLLQEGHSQNLSGSIAGASESFLSKSSARTVDKFLAKWTKVICIAFFVLTIICDVIAFLA
ncbi:MAG: preprotein translocase subunit SecG [Oscillospiraceae bacterium]|nr:preprotein translocase subunit SecG [Oscillospiraceae bacterium]